MTEFTEASKRLLRGAIDTHIHANPYCKKLNSSALEVAKQARQAGMMAIVFKCDHFPTAGNAYLISHIIKDLRVFGMIVLNKFVGGLNVAAVEDAITFGEGEAGLYTKIISMPTISAPGFKGIVGSVAGTVNIKQNGKLVPQIKSICKVVAKYDLALATGHLVYDEIVPVIEEARTQGVKKIIVTHPQDITPLLSVKQQISLTEMGAYMEICYCQATDYYREKYKHYDYTPSRLVGEIMKVGVERCIFASDFGGDPGTNPPPVEGLRMFIEDMLRFGLSEKDIEIMKANAANLLGLQRK
jgi:hypothetical protein